jgi:phosphotransacetylase
MKILAIAVRMVVLLLGGAEALVKDILLVPDLETGNMLVKQLAYLAQAEGAGIVLGARVPIILTSRADTVLARMASCGVALVAARRGRISAS